MSNSNEQKLVKRSLPKKMYKWSSEASDHIKTLRVMLGVALLVIIYGIYSVSQVPKQILLYETPNLQSGSTRHISEIPAYSIYSFALYVFQQVKTANDKSIDLQKNLISYSNYMSPEFYNLLLIKTKIEIDDSLASKGVSQEIREMSGARFDDEHVFKLSPEKWVVYLDLNIINRLNGQKIKDFNIRYPIVVQVADFNAKTNPIGLQLTGFYQEPTRINN